MKKPYWVNVFASPEDGRIVYSMYRSDTREHSQFMAAHVDPTWLKLIFRVKVIAK